MADTHRIFVFGSNLAGIHGAGAALHAKRSYGAIQGVGQGMTGRSYALPTKNENLQSLSLEEIGQHVELFKKFAVNHLWVQFNITQIGCGLAGYKPQDIAPMFTTFSYLSNLWYDKAWRPWLKSAQYWEGPL